MAKDYFNNMFVGQEFAVTKQNYEVSTYNLGGKWLALYEFNLMLVRLDLSKHVLIGSCDECNREDEKYDYTYMENTKIRSLGKEEIKGIKRRFK